MAKKQEWTQRREAIFLRVLRSTANVSAAARAATLTRKAAYAQRQVNDTFREEWDMALEDALDDLEHSLRQRAIEGTEKPVYYAGKECGSTTNYNDTLGMFLLRARRKQVFGDDGRVKSKGDEPMTEQSTARERLWSKLDEMRQRLGGDVGFEADEAVKND
ncbi:MAG: hypothetical protein KAI28_09010 [Sphingomonadales bacterium]|nr:hypothetical protein [Sphingomonadales bacterium]